MLFSYRNNPFFLKFHYSPFSRLSRHIAEESINLFCCKKSILSDLWHGHQAFSGKGVGLPLGVLHPFMILNISSGESSFMPKKYVPKLMKQSEDIARPAIAHADVG